MRSNRRKKRPSILSEGTKAIPTPQGDNHSSDLADAAESRIAERPIAASSEDASLPAIDLNGEFAKRAEALKQEEMRLSTLWMKLKLDQDKLEIAQDACRRENERLEKWNKDLLAKEEALSAREAAVANAEKEVEDDFRARRKEFNDDQIAQEEDLINRRKREEEEWQSGYNARRKAQIDAFQQEIKSQRESFLEWQRGQTAAFAERENQIAKSESEYAELLVKSENFNNEQKRIQREEARLKQREDALDKEVDNRANQVIEAAKADHAREIKTRDERIAALVKERNDLQRKFDELARILDRTGEDPRKFLAEITAATSRYDKQLEDGLSTNNVIINQKDEAIKQLNAQYEELSSKYTELQRQQNREAILQTQLRCVKGELEETNITLAELEGERKRRAAAAAQDAASHEVSIRKLDPDLVRTINARGREASPQDSELSWLEHIYQKMQDYHTPFSRRILYAFHTALKNAEFAPLTVLAGVSGTGKSMLPDLYASFGGINFISVPVQPNWDCPESLLGFFNSLSGIFEATPLLKFLAHTQLWDKDFIPDGSNPQERDVSDNGLKDTMSIVLLDEMNLAHIELYFADFLSKLEERRGRTAADIPTLKIKLTDSQDPFLLPLGRNVLWVGTMNQDETTKSLSDKVLDRSAIIDFPRPITFNRRERLLPREGDFAPAPLINTDTWMQWNSTLLADAQSPLFTSDDNPTIEKYKKIVEDINDHMAKAGRALGHRVWQSIEMYMANYPLVRFYSAQGGEKKEWEDAIKTAFEDQLIQKIMPKLRGVDTTSSCLDEIGRILRDHQISEKLCMDFEDAMSSLGNGQFIWNSSNYFSMNNDLELPGGIHRSDYQSSVSAPHVQPSSGQEQTQREQPRAIAPKSIAPSDHSASVIAVSAGKLCTSPEQGFRSFLEFLDPNFTPDEIKVIVDIFKNTETFIKKWNAVKDAEPSAQGVMFTHLNSKIPNLAKKLITALKNRDL